MNHIIYKWIEEDSMVVPSYNNRRRERDLLKKKLGGRLIETLIEKKVLHLRAVLLIARLNIRKCFNIFHLRKQK